jgi:hypothetical protein
MLPAARCYKNCSGDVLPLDRHAGSRLPGKNLREGGVADFLHHTEPLRCVWKNTCHTPDHLLP